MLIVVIKFTTSEAEIWWLLKCVTNGFSNNSNVDTSQLFKIMFSDSPIAQKYKLGADKMRYSINFGIGLYFKRTLMQSDFYI